MATAQGGSGVAFSKYGIGEIIPEGVANQLKKVTNLWTKADQSALEDELAEDAPDDEDE